MTSHFERPDVEPGPAAVPHEGEGKQWHDPNKDEREHLRQELVNAPALDFQRYLSDRDYKLYIFENPAMKEIQDDIIANALECIEDQRRDFNLSVEQMDKIIAIFEPGVHKWMVENKELGNEVKFLLRLIIDSPIMQELKRKALESPEWNHDAGTGTQERASEAPDDLSA